MARANTLFDGSKWDTQFFTIHDALQKRPPTEYVIEDILPKSSITIVYGAPGSFKTNLVIDACICSALQIPWLQGEGFDGFKTKKVSVLWVDMDSGSELLHERFRASAKAHAKNIHHLNSIQLHYASFLDPIFSANEDAPVNELIRRALIQDTGIIVFDNLGTISGGLQENTSDMIQVTTRLRMIANRTSAAVIAIHHVAKNGETTVKSSRGHGSIDAATDNAFYVDAEENAVTIRQTKARRHKLPDFGAVFEYEHRPTTRDLQWMRFVGMEPELPTYYLKAKQTLLNFYKKHSEANQTILVELLNDAKVGKNRARAILNTFAKCNFLKVKAGQKHNQKLFQLGNIDAKISLF